MSLAQLFFHAAVHQVPQILLYDELKTERGDPLLFIQQEETLLPGLNRFLHKMYQGRRNKGPHLGNQCCLPRSCVPDQGHSLPSEVTGIEVVVEVLLFDFLQLCFLEDNRKGRR